MRLLILIAAVVMLVFYFRSLLPRPRSQQDRKKARGQDYLPETMVSCAHCRLYLPESEAMSTEGNCFCNREHYRAWLDAQRGKKK